MKPRNGDTLVEQRLAVRRALLAQRQVIALRLGDSTASKGNGSAYPRSATMRLLSARPQMMGKLLAGVSLLLLGTGFLRTLSTGLALAGILRSVVPGLQAQPSVRKSSPP